jgi:ATP-binding cassette subfamily C protein LapB
LSSNPATGPAGVPAIVQAPAAGSAEAAADPLLQAVLWLCRKHGLERSAQSLLASLSLDGLMGPTQAVRLLREAGFNAALVQRQPSRILSLLMPVVLLLKNGDAAIVTKRLPTKRGRVAEYELVLPGPDGLVCTTTEEELLKEYCGYALIATPRARGTPADLEDGPEGHWLWGTLKRFSPYYRSAMLAALVSNAMMLATGIFTSVVYDKVIPHKSFVTLWMLAIGAVMAIGFDLAAKQLRSYLLDLAGKKADLALGNLLFKQTLDIRLEHRPESSGAFAHYLGQIEVVREFTASASLSVVTDIPFIALFIFMTYTIAGPLVLVLLIAVPAVLVMSLGVQSLLKRFMSANMKQHADLNGTLIEVVEGMEDVRAAGAQGQFLRRYEEANAEAAHSSVRARSLSAWVTNVSGIAQQLVTVAMLVWGVHLIDQKQLSGGALIAAVMFAGRAIAPLSSVVMLAMRFQGAKAAMRALNELMSRPTVREPGKRYLPRPELQGQMALRKVSFAYPQGSRLHAPVVLKDVDIHVQPGERVAILGKIGSGKSTILRLLGGLYLPTEGFVEIDGLDLRQIDPSDFRNRVGFVAQEPRLFNGTMRENILMGRANADPARMTAVAKLTGLDKIADAHPLGYDMPVGEKGALLSGGQRQLVALARCLVTQPQILLMDEPTSSMDAQAESSFINHLRGAVGNRTLVLVTHRPALLDVVNRVIVVDNGRILCDGPKPYVMALLAGATPQQAQAAAQAAATAAQRPAAAPGNTAHEAAAAQAMQAAQARAAQIQAQQQAEAARNAGPELAGMSVRPA